ncbi:MAG: hypothetical protein ACE5K3_09850, partial [bacterium]
NATMVGKTGEEQESYALAKQGILFAINELNTSSGTEPDYNPTAWLNGENWDEGNWNPFDLNSDGENDVQIRLDKDDIPHPDDPAFDSIDDDNGDLNYITIESQDLPKKLVTLQAITKNTSPLLDYVRFINSDTDFADNTFGLTGSGSLIEGDAPFCVLGNVTWEDGSSNNLTLSGSNSKAIIYGKISDGGVSNLLINGEDPDSGYYYFFDPNDPSYDDPALFDTAAGHYFSSAHLPSCYDYSGGTPSFYYGSTQATFWPQIKKERYKNLASGVNCYLPNSSEMNKRTEWSDPNNDNDYPDYDNDTNDEWFNDGDGSTDPTIVTTSYHYYPRAARLVLNNIDTNASGYKDLTEQLSDGTISTIDYSSITNNIIYAEGDLSVCGIIPAGKKLTIASGGNIFIDSNLLKEANSASLALLAKQNIVLNPTLRYGMDSGNSSSNESWYNPDYCLGNPDVINFASPTDSSGVTLGADEEKIYTLDIDLGRVITGGRIVLWNYQDAEDYVANLETELEVWVTRQDSPPSTSANWNQKVLPLQDVPTGDSFNIDFTPRTFRWIRLNLRAHNTDGVNPHDFDLSNERLDAIEISFYGIDAALSAEEGSLGMVTGGGVNQDETILPNNDAYKPPDAGGLKPPSDGGTSSRRLFLWGALAEEELTGRVWGWNYITYVYDSNLSSNPPPALPPSVNLVSLKRK